VGDHAPARQQCLWSNAHLNLEAVIDLDDAAKELNILHEARKLPLIPQGSEPLLQFWRNLWFLWQVELGLVAGPF
jgi:hypothetical protein